MARKKVVDQVSLDTCLTSVLAQAREQFGEDRVFTGTESEQRLVGLYMPALSLRYLYQCNIMPLSRMEQIVGTQESCKSAFLYEHYRWIRCNGGMSYHIENESKDSASLRMSLLNYDSGAANLLVSESLEDWQKYMTFLLRPDVIKDKLIGTKDAPGPGKTVPIGFGVDSLTAKSSTETQEAMDERGYADRSHPVEALKLSSYLKAMPQKLAGWPFWFGAVNHLKPQKTMIGAPDYHVPGGYSVKFQETFETRLSRIDDINLVEEQGALIKFVTAKNSLGPGRKTIQAALKWFVDPVNGRQHSYWDWHSATIDLLDKQLKGGLRSAAMDIVDIHVVTKGGKKVWSKALDIPSDDPQPYGIAGDRLENSPHLVSALHKLLGVREYTVFKPGVDYSTQLKDAILAVERVHGYEADTRDGEPAVAPNE